MNSDTKRIAWTPVLNMKVWGVGIVVTATAKNCNDTLNVQWNATCKEEKMYKLIPLPPTHRPANFFLLNAGTWRKSVSYFHDSSLCQILLS